MASSSQSDRSISGISLPQWMKNKINDRYDLDQNAFSPPTEDDSFFYIRYPKAESKSIEHEANNNGPVFRSVRDVLENHTPPCQEFIPAARATPRELGMKHGLIEPPLGVAKSTGTDDGFHSAAAACGQSVVAVAHQMIASGKLLARHPLSDSEEEAATAPPAHVLARRRGSRSLPSSPQTSPRLSRKNPYFTNGLLGSSENIAAGETSSQGWMTNYIRDSKSLRGSMAELKIIEESPSPVQPVQPVIIKPKVKVAKPKPSQLREMNFWSPTSM